MHAWHSCVRVCVCLQKVRLSICVAHQQAHRRYENPVYHARNTLVSHRKTTHSQWVNTTISDVNMDLWAHRPHKYVNKMCTPISFNGPNRHMTKTTTLGCKPQVAHTQCWTWIFHLSEHNLTVLPWVYKKLSACKSLPVQLILISTRVQPVRCEFKCNRKYDYEHGMHRTASWLVAL